MLGACSRYLGEERRGLYRILVRKAEGKRLLGKSWRMWEENILMDLQEVGWEAWSGLIWLGRGGR